jgi:polyhydroxybutyrate depolymerase
MTADKTTRFPQPRKIRLEIVGAVIAYLLVLAAGFAIFAPTNGSLQSGGETRRYLLYVPRSLDQSRPIPLVITIHGFAEWPAHVRDVTRWNKLADREGFVVVYPSGTKFPKRWAAFNENNSGSGETKDVQFLADLIAKLGSEYNIDPERIFVNGFSNGGGMSYLAGCQLADRVAAIGGVSGAYLFPLEDCRPSRPIPMIAFHGTADPIVPFNGGPSPSFDIPFAAIPQWTAGRAAVNGCSTTPEISQLASGVSRFQYTGCSQGADVLLYTLEGQGHDWAGGKSLPKWLVGEHSDALNTTELIWQFFKEHPLP